tara:strand:- start:377 stop:712 length:336 start_codon:yes stop_codon:yes gene_type:complete
MATRSIICYRRSSKNQRGRVGDFVENPEFGELIYKGRVYGPDDIDQFNKDAKDLSTEGRFFQPPFVKMVEIEEAPKEAPKTATQKSEPKPPAKKAPAKTAPAKNAAKKASK